MEMDGNKNTVRDSRLSQSDSHNADVNGNVVGSDIVGLSNDDIAWMQSGTRGNDRKHKTTDNNCNGTTKKTMGNAIDGGGDGDNSMGNVNTYENGL